MKIANLTQHAATPAQVDAGVFDLLTDEQKNELLNFDVIPKHVDLFNHAFALATIAKKSGADAAMIGGAPYLMGVLEGTLKIAGIKPLYAFSKRNSVDVHNADGTVSKKVVFEHLGFFEP